MTCLVAYLLALLQNFSLFLACKGEHLSHDQSWLFNLPFSGLALQGWLASQHHLLHLNWRRLQLSLNHLLLWWEYFNFVSSHLFSYLWILVSNQICSPGAASSTSSTSSEDRQAGGEIFMFIVQFAASKFYQYRVIFTYLHLWCPDAGEEIGDAFAPWNIRGDYQEVHPSFKSQEWEIVR